MAAALTKEKIGFLHRVPCLSSRLGEAGVDEEVTRQWTSVAAEEDHPVTSEFLSDASPPRQLIIGLPSGASETPCSAASGVHSLKDILTDGSVAKGLHAKAL